MTYKTARSVLINKSPLQHMSHQCHALISISRKVMIAAKANRVNSSMAESQLINPLNNI